MHLFNSAQHQHIEAKTKWTPNSQTTCWSAFSWMKMFEFRLKFHWSLFLRVQLTIIHHCFRQWLGAVQATSHYLNQWWLVHWCIYASLGLNELRPHHHISPLNDFTMETLDKNDYHFKSNFTWDFSQGVLHPLSKFGDHKSNAWWVMVWTSSVLTHWHTQIEIGYDNTRRLEKCVPIIMYKYIPVYCHPFLYYTAKNCHNTVNFLKDTKGEMRVCSVRSQVCSVLYLCLCCAVCNTVI